jgi:hypothetical protein
MYYRYIARMTTLNSIHRREQACDEQQIRSCQSATLSQEPASFAPFFPNTPDKIPPIPHLVPPHPTPPPAQLLRSKEAATTQR